MKLTCCACKKSKESSEFNKDRTTPTGYRYRCRDCRKIRAKELYRESDHKKEYMRKWRSENKKKVERYNKHFRDANPDYPKQYILRKKNEQNKEGL